MISPTEDEIAAAAQALLAGKLVAFPTETVYGLGANALDAVAVARIFAAKGRPSTSPLIVHVDTVEMARGLAASWPAAADRLTARFWPGPLTLVVPKHESIPNIITAGLPNVGLRMPDHPVALALIRAAGVPLAAPSANRFTQLSPTTAEHVRQAGVADLILDGGSTTVGIESTVLSLAEDHPVLLRHGMIGVEELEEIIGSIEVRTDSGRVADSAPGQHRQHYRPRTPLHLGRPLPEGRGAYLWWSEPRSAARTVQMPRSPAAYAAILYGTLHELDREDLDWIAVEPLPHAPEWAAIEDRLARASVR